MAESEDGVKFQHFEVLRKEDGGLFELGRGAMGITYKAFDTNLRTHVALKVINGAYLNSEVARQRFLREARAAAAIRHPNVASVFHLGEEEENYFYAMEFVDGETVESWMKKHGAVPTRMALEIARQVARALAAAQKQNLVHRDIKPANIMLVVEDGEYVVKVIDFGLAKQASKEEGEDLATLTVGGFLGTPHFASPEQLEEREVDVRSDIYSLGVTLWYMLAGKTPFSGSLVQVMSQHINREPPFETLEGQPPEVVNLLRHMMAKDPAERPQAPGDLRREVEACLDSIEERADAAAETQGPVETEDAEFDTVVDEEESLAPGTLVDVGATLAGRFRLIEDCGLTERGHLYKAESIEDQNAVVALYVLEPGQLGSRDALTRLEEEVFRIQKIDSPHVRRVFSIERTQTVTFLSLEWLEGRTLLELMKQRQALPIAEATPILRQLAQGLDTLAQAGASCPDLSLFDIHLIENPGTQAGTLVRFDALRLEKHAKASPDATVVSSAASVVLNSEAFEGNPGGPFALMLATVAYELLGGLRSGAEMGTFVPLSAVPRETNDILQKALRPEATYASASETCEALAATAELQAPAAEADPPPAPAAADPAPPTTPGHAPPPFPTQFREAQKKKRGGPVLLAVAGTVVLLALAGGGIAYFVLNRDAADPIASTTPTPTPAATAEPTPTPPPTPSPEELALQEALAEARAAQEEDAYDQALRLYARAARDFPEAEEPPTELEKIAAKLRSNAVQLTPALFAELRPALEIAAQENTRSAQMILAEQLHESDPSDSLKWYLAAANQGQAEAMTAAGLMLASGKGMAAPDLQAARRWFEQAAESGDPGGAYALGEIYHFGTGVPQDQRKAFEYLSRAATFEDPRAMTLLADYYRKGHVTQPDFQEARRLLDKASQRGNLDATANLGVMDFLGEGTSDGKPNKEAAAEKFEKAAKQGHLRSGYFLAEMLWNGEGVKRDQKRARELYIGVAQAGFPPAIERCKELKIDYPE